MKKILFLILSVSFTLINVELIAQCSGGKVEICHSVGNACVTMCVPPNAVAAHLSHGDFIGSCTGGSLYGLRDNGLGGFDFAQFNPITGLSTTLIPSITTEVLTFSSTFDAVNGRYIFIGDRNPSMHFVVDVSNLTFTSTPIVGTPVTEYQYDINNNVIYGLRGNMSGSFDFVEVDAATGNVTNTLFFGITTEIAVGTSTYDQLNSRYFFVAERNPSQHFVIDVANATFTSTTIIGNITIEYEYDVISNVIYGLKVVSNSQIDFVEVDPLTGNVNNILIPSVVSVLKRGTTTFDPLNKRYFFIGERNPSKHFVIDILPTPSFTSTNISDNRIEYEFYSCASVCPACKTEKVETDDIYKNKVIEEPFTVYPNPGSKEISFDYTINEKEEMLSIEIYDMYGKSVIKLLENKYQKSGDYHIKWTLDDSIENGIYFYKIFDNNRQFTGKLFIVK